MKKNKSCEFAEADFDDLGSVVVHWRECPKVAAIEPYCTASCRKVMLRAERGPKTKWK